jgi:hypothetical protein
MDASQNAEQVLASSSCDTKVDFHRQDAELSSDFTESVALSDSDMTDLQSQLQTSFNNGDDKAEIQAYILSVGIVNRASKLSMVSIVFQLWLIIISNMRFCYRIEFLKRNNGVLYIIFM